ncbi:SemiSWEET family sugar transporter [Roseibium alexandrii]|uniref:SemiSWEET family sugar transporter n=1 Tax=Roseibium alexandrii TaxID=388408 RepID=UPI003752DA0B
MIDFLAYVGGIFAMISFLPQIMKSLATRSTEDISWMLLATTLVSVTAYEFYAIALGLLPVVILNAIFFVTVVIMMILKYRFDNLRPKLAFQNEAGE